MNHKTTTKEAPVGASNKLRCPSCKSEDVQEKLIRQGNGVVGPGYFAKIVDRFYVCNSCSIRFEGPKDDQEKIKQ